jgi:hypothetical protein
MPRSIRTPSEIPLSRLTRSDYERFLEQASRRRFSFVRFQDFLPDRPSLPNRFIALRHDVDFAPVYAAEMAALEHAAGVASTYFFLVDGQFYDVTSRETITSLRTIRDLGHEIGLHVAMRSAVEPDAGAEVAFRLQLLGDLAGCSVRSFSQHDPVNAGYAQVRLPHGHAECVDAQDAIARHDLLYVSESAMMWRKHTFETALDADRNLCLLAHPHSWMHPEDDYIAMIRDLERRELDRVSGNYDAFVDALAGYYARRLREDV